MWAAYDWDNQSFDLDTFAGCMCFFKLETGNRREYVNASRNQSDLKDCPWSLEIINGQTRERRTEPRQRAPHSRGVFRGAPNPEVYVARRAREAVESESVGAYDQVVNLLVAKG